MILSAENFNPSNIKIHEKSQKNILVYYIEHVTINKYVKTYSVNPCTLFSDTSMDTLKKLMEINI